LCAWNISLAYADLHLHSKRLANPIPGYFTHGETKFLASLVDWEKEIVG
jgi:ribosomal protein S17E